MSPACSSLAAASLIEFLGEIRTECNLQKIRGRGHLEWSFFAICFAASSVSERLVRGLRFFQPLATRHPPLRYWFPDAAAILCGQV